MTVSIGFLYDSVNYGVLPNPSAMYMDGKFAVPADVWALHPDALRITVFASTAGDMQDVEPGNAEPEPCADAAVWRLNQGLWTAAYINANVDGWLGRYTARLATHGVTWTAPSEWATVAGGKPGIYWIAVEATGVPHLNPASIATQYAEEVPMNGGRVDVSETLAPFPIPPTVTPPKPAPVPKPAPTPTPTPVPQGVHMASTFEPVHKTVISVAPDGAVYTAPGLVDVYCGALNAHSGPTYNLPAGYTVDDIVADGAGGYWIIVTSPQYGANPFRQYHFPANGSAKGTTSY
jgi:hypothetical protein